MSIDKAAHELLNFRAGKDWCDEEYGNRGGASPDQWPDPEEGGGEDG